MELWKHTAVSHPVQGLKSFKLMNIPCWWLIIIGTLWYNASEMQYSISWAQHMSLRLASLLFNFFWAPEFIFILRWCQSGIKPQYTGSTPSGTDLCKQGEVCLSLSESLCWLDKLGVFQVIFIYLFTFSYCSLTTAKGLATLTVYTEVHALLSDSLQANDDKCGGKERWLLKNDLRKQNLQK